MLKHCRIGRYTGQPCFDRQRLSPCRSKRRLIASSLLTSLKPGAATPKEARRAVLSFIIVSVLVRRRQRRGAMEKLKGPFLLPEVFGQNRPRLARRSAKSRELIVKGIEAKQNTGSTHDVNRWRANENATRHLFRGLRQKPVRVTRAVIVGPDREHVAASQVNRHAILSRLISPHRFLTA